MSLWGSSQLCPCVVEVGLGGPDHRNLLIRKRIFYAHAVDAELSFGLPEQALRSLQRQLEFARLQFHQHLARLHLLPEFHQHLSNHPGYLTAHAAPDPAR